MAIGLYKNTTIKPPPSSRPNSDPLSLPTLVPLTIFDKAAFDLHVAVLYAFGPPMPSNEVMKEALSKVLEYFPHLAGRFTTDGKGKTCIVLNNAGVRVTETYLPTTLSEQLPFEPSKEVNHLLPPVEGVEEYLLLIQLNRYACGGLVIGQTAHHRVSDATAPEIGNTLCPNLEADSWMRFQFHELDFGGGGPCAFYPSNLPVEGLFIFLPSCQEGGGVDVVMSLLLQHVLQFKKISHSLE